MIPPLYQMYRESETSVANECAVRTAKRMARMFAVSTTFGRENSYIAVAHKTTWKSLGERSRQTRLCQLSFYYSQWRGKFNPNAHLLPSARLFPALAPGYRTSWWLTRWHAISLHTITEPGIKDAATLHERGSCTCNRLL